MLFIEELTAGTGEISYRTVFGTGCGNFVLPVVKLMGMFKLLLCNVFTYGTVFSSFLGGNRDVKAVSVLVSLVTAGGTLVPMFVFITRPFCGVTVTV